MRTKFEIIEPDKGNYLYLKQILISDGDEHTFSVQLEPATYLPRLLESVYPAVQGYAVKVGRVISADWSTTSSNDHGYLFYLPHSENRIEIAPVVDWISREPGQAIEMGEAIDVDEFEYDYIADFEGVVMEIRDLLEILLETNKEVLEWYEEHDEESVSIPEWQAKIQQANQLLTYYQQHGSSGGSAREHDVKMVEQFLDRSGSTPDYFSNKYILEKNLVSDFIVKILKSDDEEYIDTQITWLGLGSTEVQRQALNTIIKNPDERLKSGVLHIIYSEDSELTPKAMHLLAEMGVESEKLEYEARNALTGGNLGTKSEHPSIRKAATEVLGKIQDTDSIDVLENAAENDPEKSVRDAASTALKKIKE